MRAPKSLQKYCELIASCDELMKFGKINEALSKLSELNAAKIPREYRQPLAKICRRGGKIDQGLRLLYPVIRHEGKSSEAATESEICEYAVLLSRNGLIQEAIELLNSIESPKIPEVKLYLAYCYISLWDYEKAIPYLKSFLSLEIDNYSKVIAEVNLASAYLALDQIDEADALLQRTISNARQLTATRLVGNCLELRAQARLHRGRLSEVYNDLNEAHGIFSQSTSYDELLTRKWRAIATAIETKDTTVLLEFQKEALQREHWESVRDADLFMLKIDFQQKRLNHLFFGTPLESYRQRILRKIGREPSDDFILGTPGNLELDLLSGQVTGAENLKPGQKIHQVIALLISDLYAPKSLGGLFSELYPDEHFDVNSSAFRIHQILRRTRRWLEENEIPASIEQHDGKYRFVIQGNFSIRTPRIKPQIQTQWVKWQELKLHFPGGVQFTAQEACSKLNMSRSGFHRLVEWAMKYGELRRNGHGKMTVHEVISNTTEK